MAPVGPATRSPPRSRCSRRATTSRSRKLRTTITNQDGDVVLDGTALVWTEPSERAEPRPRAGGPGRGARPAMSTWFSAAAILPQLRARWALSVTSAAWLTIAVQLGFVAGALVSSLLNLADVVRRGRLIAASARSAPAAANSRSSPARTRRRAIPLRFAHRCLPRRRLSAGAEADRDLVPPRPRHRARRPDRRAHARLGARRTSSRPRRRSTGGSSSSRPRLLTLAGGVFAARPARRAVSLPQAPFDPRQAGRFSRNRGVRLASLGYFGHMWELYAMWALVPGLRHAPRSTPDGARRGLARHLRGDRGRRARLLRRRRARRPLGARRTTPALMAVSGALRAPHRPASTVPPGVALRRRSSGASPWSRDSAQFSALVTELADQAYVGTALTLQLASASC